MNRREWNDLMHQIQLLSDNIDGLMNKEENGYHRRGLQRLKGNVVKMIGNLTVCIEPIENSHNSQFPGIEELKAIDRKKVEKKTMSPIELRIARQEWERIKKERGLD